MASPLGRRLVGRAVLVVLLVLVAMPLYLTISPAWRPTAARLACGVALAAGCVRARRRARDAAAAHVPSPFEAPPLPAPAVQLDLAFLRLRDDLVASVRSRRYFDVVLWPKLTALAGAALPCPPRRRVLRRRGPALRVLEGLISRIEASR